MTVMDNRFSSIKVDAITALQGIRFAQHANSPLCSGSFDFQYLGDVDTSKIPLSFIAGPSHDVWTNDEATSAWFADHFAYGCSASATHVNTGILVAVVPGTERAKNTLVLTEVLFHAMTTGHPSADAGGEPTFVLKAVPLCSQAATYLPTPPRSPQPPAEDIRAEFLPSLVTLCADAEATARKRKNVADVFHEASKLRRKAKRHGEERVDAHQSTETADINVLVGQKRPKTEAHRKVPEEQYHLIKSVQERSTTADVQRPRPPTGNISGIALEQTRRPLSRSPSMSAENRPLSRRELADGSVKPSALSYMSSLTEASNMEQRNKDSISRLVMAGMRLHGLEPRRRTGHVRRFSDLPRNAQTTASDVNAVPDHASANVDEYKLVYHQTYKGVVFALRRSICTEPMYSNPELVQDIVDKLLTIFCTQPITTATKTAVTKASFGGRSIESDPT